MGTKQSKSIAIIDDYSIVTVPKEYKLLKIASYNVDLRTSVNADVRIKEILSYVISSYKNKDIDIMNLQGIYDVLSLCTLISEIKSYYKSQNMTIYFAPDINSEGEPNFDHSRQERRSRGLTDYKSGLTQLNLKKLKKISYNLTLSKHKIINTIYSELDDKTDMDDIFGVQTVLGINVVICDTLISIYNLSMCKDIKSSNVINDVVRKTEFETLSKIIEKNKMVLKADEFAPYIKRDIHLIVGTLNIPEIVNDSINSEYVKFIKSSNCVDIFRELSSDSLGYTTSYKERTSYILMQCYDDVNSNIDSQKKINHIFKKYGIRYIESYVINFNKHIINYPIECICLLKIV